MSTPEVSDVNPIIDQTAHDRTDLFQVIDSLPSDPFVVVENILQYNASNPRTPIILSGIGRSGDFVRNYGTTLNELSKTDGEKKARELATAFQGILDRSAAVIFGVWYGIK